MKNYNEIYENKNEVAEQLQQQKSQPIVNKTNENTKTFLKCENNYQKFADKNYQLKTQENINEITENTKAFSKCETTNSNNHYFRITGYCPEHDFCFIIDCNGMFEKLWQFSSALIQKGLKVLEVSNSDKFIDVNIEPIKEDKDRIILRATAEGKPKYVDQSINGFTYKAVKVADKVYAINK